jgi:hypothetical protein
MRRSLGAANSSGPVVPAPDDRRVQSIGGIIYGMGKPKFAEKAYPSTTLFTTSPT